MDNTKKIVAIGDSITYGFPYLPTASWVQLTSETLGIPIINKGINGNTTGEMVARFERDVLRLLPSHVIIMGGTNDACGGMEAEVVAANICYMIEAAQQRAVTPIIGLPIPCNYQQDEYMLALYREDMREYALANQLPVIDFHAAFLRSGSRQSELTYYADVLHPNERGYQVMAAAAAKVL
ncbi:MAG: GDSL-like Lipase/Acylhydrolase family protein [Firmicutes bacterium]|nr:GDSL-like Lipase/Acylhydrolase family protein [Bacillota bacterium]